MKKILEFATSTVLISVLAVFLYGGVLTSNAGDNAYDTNTETAIAQESNDEVYHYEGLTFPVPRPIPQEPVRVTFE